MFKRIYLKFQVLERFPDLYLKKVLQKELVKPSVGRHIALLSRVQNDCL